MKDQILLSASTQEHLVDNLFSLAITQKPKSAKIFMQLFGNKVNTSHIPTIVDTLDQHLPNVLRTECFNEEDIPFHIEVKNTELGHLFEHILLEYLCQLKIAKGSNRATFSGRTRWNWVKDPEGTFHIRLSCGERDADLLPEAIEKTISLMKIIMQDETPAVDTLVIKENGEATLKLTDPLLFRSAGNGLKNGESHEEK